MNIENMRAFLEIASAGSFQVAAERLHITQSTISARIKMLEQRLNRVLYLRKRSGIELTDAGLRFLRHAQSCVQSWERAQQEIALPDEFDNLVSLGIQTNYWQRLVVPWTNWMQAQAPQYATKIVSDYSEKLLSLIRDGMLDLALVYTVRQQAGFNVEILCEDNLVLVSTEPRTLNKGWTPGYIFVDWAEDFLAEHSSAFPDSPPPRLSVGSAAIAMAHILEQGGSGYLLEKDIQQHLSRGELFRIANAPVFKRRGFLVSPRDSHIQPAIETAIRGLRDVLHSHSKL